MPAVSVIMPVYNPQQFIEQAIESVLNQIYLDFELLIIDDGSDDDYFTELDELILSDKRIKYYYKKHTGLADTLNFGINESTGELIARIDADDIWEPEKLQVQLKYMSDDSELDFLATSVKFIDENGEQIVGMQGFNNGSSVEYEKLTHLILRNNIICASSLIYYRHIHDHIGNYDNRYVTSMDYDFIIRVMKQFYGVIIQEDLVSYRITDTMMTRVLREQMISESIRIKRNATKIFGSSIKEKLMVYLDIIRLIIWRYTQKYKRR